jgi:hypothetical protein
MKINKYFTLHKFSVFVGAVAAFGMGYLGGFCLTLLSVCESMGYSSVTYCPFEPINQRYKFIK